MLKMIWNAETPAVDEAPEAVPLGRQHASQALELATLTRPGPFGPRTIELGESSAVSTVNDSWPWSASACMPARSGKSAVSARIQTFKAEGLRAD